MAQPLAVGMQVRTFYGIGVVDALLPEGVRVHLPQHGLLMRCKYGDVQPFAPVSPAKSRPQRAVSSGRPNEAKTRRALEALRFGIAPRDALGQLTVGLESLESWVLSRLPKPEQPSPTLSEVCGAFGTGKSHTMAAIRHIARGQQFLTVQIEVDGRGISLSDPAGFLLHLWATLEGQTSDTSTPLLNLNLQASGNGASSSYSALQPYERVLANHQTAHYLRRRGFVDLFEERLDALMSCNDQEPVVEVARDIFSEARRAALPWTEARESVRPTRLIGRAVDERPKDFVDCLFGYAALTKSAGYGGLVVTVDEFEVEHIATEVQRFRFAKVAGQLAGRIGRDQAGAIPLAVFIATVGTEGHVGDQVVAKMLSMAGSDATTSRRVLHRWSQRNLLTLARRIHSLYRDAYALPDGFNEAEALSVVDALATMNGFGAEGHIRTFIKRYVARLDQRVGPPCQ